MGTKGVEALKDILQTTAKNVKGSSGIEKEFRTYANEVLTAVGRPTAAADAVKVALVAPETAAPPTLRH